MSSTYNFDPAARITVGTVGEPGRRRFYLQAGSGGDMVTLLMEKTQAEALARHVEELLEKLEASGQSGGDDIDPRELDLQEPVVEAFRVGAMQLGYDADRDLVLLQCDEIVADDDQPEMPASARFWATRAQMRALAGRAVDAVAGGRPVCPICGAPMDADGHFCPGRNGHRRPNEIT